MTADNLEQIFNYIKDLSLKDALVYLVSKGVLDFSKLSYQKIKKVIKDKQNEGRYAFVPDVEEAIYLQKSASNPNYRELFLLVPKYKYMGLIRTGFLLKEYNDKISNNIDVDKNKQRVSEIKMQILSRPGGSSLLKITKFPSTEFFSVVLSYLHKLKVNNYPDEHLEDEFNDLVNSWQSSSKFVKAGDKNEVVITFCRDKMEKEFNRFFLLGLYDNIETIEKSIKEIEREFSNNGYTIIMNKKENEKLPILEVFIFRKI
jgi:hypothetical protein